MAPILTTAVGRRKTAIASVRLYPADTNSTMVNGKEAFAYFKTADRVRTVEEAMCVANPAKNYTVVAHVEGGGLAAQAGALRHSIARALIKIEPNLRATLKTAGLLTRDPRAKERKKPGLVKARKRKQWSKR